MNAALFWKEYRQQRYILLALTILAAVSILSFIGFLGRGSGAGTFDDDRLQSTIDVALHVSRRGLWRDRRGVASGRRGRRWNAFVSGQSGWPAQPYLETQTVGGRRSYFIAVFDVDRLDGGFWIRDMGCRASLADCWAARSRVGTVGRRLASNRLGRRVDRHRVLGGQFVDRHWRRPRRLGADPPVADRAPAACDLWVVASFLSRRFLAQIGSSEADRWIIVLACLNSTCV